MSLSPQTTEPESTIPDQELGQPAAVNETVKLASDDGTSGETVVFAAEPEFRLSGIDDRERALPVRQGDLTRLLLAEPGLSQDDREKLGQLGRLLGAMFHSEFYEKLCELKELYAPLDPDSDYASLKAFTLKPSERSDEDFLAPFEAALWRANYRPLNLDILAAAVSAPNEMGLTYTPDFSLFEHMRVYVRGYTQITRECRSIKSRFRKRKVSLEAYQRIIVALKFNDGAKLDPYVRSEVFYLRMFKDVPHVDMEMHLPEQGSKVRMRNIDKAQIYSPMVMGMSTIVGKMLFVGLGVGVSGVIPLGTLAALLVAPISAGVNSFFGFQRAKKKHMMAMIQKLYYQTLANNASVLTRLVDSAEDEEYKEAMLAYFFLWRSIGSANPWNVSRLDDHIEQYLTEKTGVSINFEVSDALSKLLRLGLAHRDPQGFLYATPIDQALTALDRRWDDTFRYP